MLHNKDIKNFAELKSVFVDKHKNQEFFTRLIGVLKLGKHHALFSSVKQKGIPVLLLIRILISFPFIGQKNVCGFTNSFWKRYAKFGKDAYYRLKNNPKINWRAFLLAVVKRSETTLQERKTKNKNDEKEIRAFIFDDTPIQKTGRFIEGISQIWNHVAKRYHLGYQLLVMGLYNGTAFKPLDFSLHREKGKNKSRSYGLKAKHLKKQFLKKRDAKSNGAKRKRELGTSKIKALVKMLKHAVTNGISADYVLTDSWFTCRETVDAARRHGMHYIGMFSKVKTKFVYNNKELTYKEIRHVNRKKVKRNRRFKLYYIRTVVSWNGRKVALFAIRKGKTGKWKCLINTNLSLNFTKTLEIYQIRWSIEVFFKESKQLLNLGKSQSQDFDAQIADITLSMLQYIFLILQNSIEKYESLGKLFEHRKSQVVELRLHQRLVALLIAVVELIAELFEQADYERVFEKAIYNERVYEKLSRLINVEQNIFEVAA